MERESRGWTRRRVVYGSLGVLSMIVGTGWAASAWQDARERRATESWVARVTQEAAAYAFDGRLNSYHQLPDLMQYAKVHPPAQLLLACWFTHTGAWDSALHHLKGRALKDSREALLLREFIQRRPQASRWMQTFLEVWQAVGRPDYRQSVLLPAPLTWNRLTVDTQSDWHSSQDARRPLLLVLNPSLASSYPEEARALIGASHSLHLLMAWCEHLNAFDPEAPLRQSWLPVVEERVSVLVGAAPQTLQLALNSFLAGHSLTEPFSRSDLEILEGLAALPVWKQPSSEQTFLELREPLAELPSPGHHAALLTRFAQGTFLGNGLLLRAQASESSLNDEDRRWLGRLLWTVGARLRDQHSLNEVETGLRAQMLGSEWSQHMPSRDDCIEWWVTLGKWQDALARSGFARWPLASLHEESSAERARDELAWVRAFDDSPLPLK